MPLHAYAFAFFSEKFTGAALPIGPGQVTENANGDKAKHRDGCS
jgi:hypothetical protein